MWAEWRTPLMLRMTMPGVKLLADAMLLSCTFTTTGSCTLLEHGGNEVE